MTLESILIRSLLTELFLLIASFSLGWLSYDRRKWKAGQADWYTRALAWVFTISALALFVNFLALIWSIGW